MNRDRFKKIMSLLCVLILISVLTVIWVDYQHASTYHGTSKFNLQIMYVPNNDRCINVSELPLDDDSIRNITSDTFSIIIKSHELNKETEYKFGLEGDRLIPGFDDSTLSPRLDLGFIEENRNYYIDFVFTINSDDPEVKSLDFWGISNIVSLKILYNSSHGLFVDLLTDYDDVSWSYGEFADVVLYMPHNQIFGIYLGIMEDA